MNDDITKLIETVLTTLAGKDKITKNLDFLESSLQRDYASFESNSRQAFDRRRGYEDRVIRVQDDKLIDDNSSVGEVIANIGKLAAGLRASQDLDNPSIKTIDV